MTRWPTCFPARTLLAALVGLAVLACGCGDDEVVDPNKLCRTGAGLGARISGTPKPVDMCVPNDQVATALGAVSPGRYDLIAAETADSITFEIRISFVSRPDLPQTLTITGDQNLPNPDDVWFFYRETKPGVYDYSSMSISGVFTLTFSDPTVAVATFTSLQINLEDQLGVPVGSRMISEGFLAVTPDNPAGP